MPAPVSRFEMILGGGWLCQADSGLGARPVSRQSVAFEQAFRPYFAGSVAKLARARVMLSTRFVRGFVKNP